MSGQGLTQRYAFTVTLKPSQYTVDGEVQYDRTHLQIIEKLQSVCAHFTVIAELTKNCNIHFHGIADFDNNHPNVIKKFTDHFRCRCKNKYVCKCIFGYVYIKVMPDELGWHDYIKKNIKTTYESLSRRPIIRDDFNVFPLALFELYGFGVL